MSPELRKILPKADRYESGGCRQNSSENVQRPPSKPELRPSMASHLYPRYMPAKKRGKGLETISPDTIPPKTTPTSIQQTLHHAVPTTKHDASDSYARYIPSSKAHTRPVRFADDALPKNPANSKRKHENIIEHLVTQHISQNNKNNIAEDSKPSRLAPKQVSVSGISDSISHAAPEKTKRKKKRKVVEDVVEDLAITNDLGGGMETIEDTRHKMILSKRDKSMKKAERLAQIAAKVAAEISGQESSLPEKQPVEVHALKPLPQPEPVRELEGKPTFSALPQWLMSPMRVSSGATCSFAGLGIPTETSNVLRSKGFDHAFAIQASVLPLLLRKNSERGDILVSAATGSGKTLAYILPMVENISHFAITRLRGLIIMPTRELVSQARDICDTCAAAYASNNRRRVKIGVAIGSQQLKAEQMAIISEEQRYDPEECHRRERIANAKWESSSQETDDEHLNFSEEKQSSTLPNHIAEYSSKVDILICTPGRLVEHLKSTRGFTLDFINWFVIDEADKLLDQSFQQWLDVVVPVLGRRAPQRVGRPGHPDITKVVLSATVTRNLGQLSALKLYRPKLVVLEGFEGPEGENVVGNSDATYNLPNSLCESAIKVENESDKPLHLLDLMNNHNMVDRTAIVSSQISSGDESDSSDGTSSSRSDNHSPKSETDSINSDVEIFDTRDSSTTKELKLFHKANGQPRGVLIFTKSNENTVRLSRLLSLLDSSIADQIGTLTSTIRSSVRKATLNSFQRGKLSILVASDLVSRGLDIPHLAHVINYDIPSSLTSYIHRVGRTARAEREGHAWTLYSNTEARWFWNEIARSALVVRGSGRKVERVNLSGRKFGEDERQQYEAALRALGKEAKESRPTTRRMKE